MKLSCLPVSFFADILAGRMSVVEWAQMGAEIGLDGVDISILFIQTCSPQEIRTIRRQVESIGMRIVMVTSYPDFTHPDPAQRQQELVLEQQVVEKAELLGAQLVRVTSGQAHPETRRKDGIAWAADGLSRLQEWARGTGITLVYENHSKPGVWQYTDFGEPPEIFLEIVRGTAPAGLGVNFDLGNAATFSEDPVALLRAVLPRLVSIHAADSGTHGALNHVLLGTGVTPYPALFAELKKAGWDGWICMEEGSNLGRQGVEAAAAYIRRTWEAS